MTNILYNIYIAIKILYIEMRFAEVFSFKQAADICLILNFDITVGSESMYSREIVVKNQVGLHARPATFFIQKANCYESGIWIEKEERRVNAKSLLGVLSMGITQGTSVTIMANGSDEKDAVDCLVKLIKSNFAE